MPRRVNEIGRVDCMCPREDGRFCDRVYAEFFLRDEGMLGKQNNQQVIWRCEAGKYCAVRRTIALQKLSARRDANMQAPK